MTEKEKNVISKLEIIKEMAKDDGVKQLAQVQIEYIRIVSKGQLGFQQEEKDEA